MEQSDPIQPDEVILRRVPEHQMSASLPRRPSAESFGPSSRDTDGLSVYREKYHTCAEVAGFRTAGKRPTWVARLRADAITNLGLTLKPAAVEAGGGLPARPGHALIEEVNCDRNPDDVEQWKQQLLAAVVDVQGGDEGFPAPAAVPAQD